MAWLWDSWEDYVYWCHPVGIPMGRFHLSQISTQLQRTEDLLQSIEQLSRAINELNVLGFKGRQFPSPKYDRQVLSKLREEVIQVVYAGEALLLYHRRLAFDDSSDNFLSSHDMLDHWDRYAASERVIYEVQRLLESAEELLEGYRRITCADEKFILDRLDLPDDLEADFRLSRDLFSVGFDDVALLIAARGLEKVIRRIAELRKIQIEVGKRISLVSEADLHDLIEAMSRLRWKAKGTLLLSKETRMLLHFIRSIRNGGAHTGKTI